MDRVNVRHLRSSALKRRGIAAFEEALQMLHQSQDCRKV
jgi:hypothetical protein